MAKLVVAGATLDLKPSPTWAFAPPGPPTVSISPSVGASSAINVGGSPAILASQLVALIELGSLCRPAQFRRPELVRDEGRCKIRQDQGG